MGWPREEIWVSLALEVPSEIYSTLALDMPYSVSPCPAMSRPIHNGLVTF